MVYVSWKKDGCTQSPLDIQPEKTSSDLVHWSINVMDNMQQNADAVQKGLQLIVRASVQQGRTRLRRLRIELWSDSFHAVLALSCGPAKC